MKNFKLAVLISGSGSNLQAIIDRFSSDPTVTISCVISNIQDAHGLERAKKAGIDNLVINHGAFLSEKSLKKS